MSVLKVVKIPLLTRITVLLPYGITSDLKVVKISLLTRMIVILLYGITEVRLRMSSKTIRVYI